jgi:hypothetical protein
MPRWFRGCVLVLAALTIPVPAFATPCSGDLLAPLEIAASADSVSVTGGTASSRILVLGYGHSWDPERYSTRFHRYRAYLQADDAGTLRLDRGPFAADTLWTAIDVASGRCGTTAAADPQQHRHKALPKAAVKLNNGQLKKIAAELPLAYLVVVRPGEGVWELSAGDGGPVDDDHALDGKVTLPFDRLAPLGEPGIPYDKVRKGDVVLLFYPHQAAASFGRVED